MSELISCGINGIACSESGVISDPIPSSSFLTVLEITAKGNIGDSDEVEVWYTLSAHGDRFATNYTKLGEFNLDSDNEITEIFAITSIYNTIKIKLKMRKNSNEIPLVVVYFKRVS